jgi:cell division protein FtsQ
VSRAVSGARRGLPAVAGVAVPTDRRFRRSDLRPDRRRRVGRAVVRVARWLLPAALGAAGVAWVGRAAASSSLLTVQRIVVRGNVRLSSGEVDSLLTGMRGENILQVAFEPYRRRVLDSPWVADVTLSRQLPSTIDVRVTERTPLAVARLGQQLYLVDNEGVIIDEYGPQYHDLDLPIVDGLVGPPSGSGSSVQVDRVRLAGALLGALGAKPEWRRRVSQVDVSNAHDAVVMFDDDPAWLHLGESEFVDRLTMYLELAPTLKEHFQDVDYVDLRFGERVFVHARRQPTRLQASNVR